MSDKCQCNNCRPQLPNMPLIVALGFSVALVASFTQPASAAEPAKAGSVSANANVVQYAPQINAAVGKSSLIKLPSPISRLAVGDKGVADVILLNPQEIYLLGKKTGTTNIMLWGKNGQSSVIDVNVGVDAEVMQAKIHELMPTERGVRVTTAADSLVLTGTVEDTAKLERVLMLAEAYAGKKVVNMLKVTAQQQVMLEVKIAEVSKSVIDKLGASVNATRNMGGGAYTIASNFLALVNGGLSLTKGANIYQIDAQKDDGIIKILAEPNIVATSGQEGSFLAGGKIFIPVAQPSAAGASTITLEEKEFGVGLRFTPTVLEGDLINLRVAPEVSELSATGTPISIAGGAQSILPSLTTRRASTTVQLHDGQSFAIAGLIKNNVTETMKRFPVVGELPIIGALFRSSAFQNDKTELMFVITPRLVKPLPADYVLPTDNFTPPTPAQFFMGGKLEGNAPAEGSQPQQPSKANTATPPSGQAGFVTK